MNRKRISECALALILLTCAGLGWAQTLSDTAMGSFTVKTELVHIMAKGEQGERGDFSLDGLHFAQAIKHKGTSYMWYDGARGPDFQVVFAPVFSRDGSRMAYLAISDDSYYYIVLDGKKLGPFDWFYYEDEEHELVFSSDSKRFAFRAANKESDPSHPCLVFCDSAIVGRYSSVVGPPPAFGPNGKRLVYFARDGKDWFGVLDGVPGKAFVRTGGLAGFSADGSRFCYMGNDADSMAYVVVNDTVYGPYWRNLSIEFSPVGNELAWSACGDSIHADTLYVNGQARAIHDRVWDITYSDDGTKMAYIAEDRDSFSLVIGPFVSAKYEDVTLFRFSPDGGHFAYAALQWPDGSEATLIEDSLPLYTYPSIFGIFFSPDGSRLASVAKLASGKFSVVMDGVAGQPYDSIDYVRFTPDSRSCYYMAKRGKKHYMVQDGIESAPYARISYDVAVDSGTNKLIYFAARKKDVGLFVIDGHETKTFDYIFGITPFTSDGSVTAFAERDRKVYRLTITPQR